MWCASWRPHQLEGRSCRQVRKPGLCRRTQNRILQSAPAAGVVLWRPADAGPPVGSAHGQAVLQRPGVRVQVHLSGERKMRSSGQHLESCRAPSRARTSPSSCPKTVCAQLHCPAAGGARLLGAVS